MNLEKLIFLVIVVFIGYLLYMSIKHKININKTEPNLTIDSFETIKRGGSGREDSFSFT